MAEIGSEEIVSLWTKRASVEDFCRAVQGAEAEPSSGGCADKAQGRAGWPSNADIAACETSTDSGEESLARLKEIEDDFLTQDLFLGDFVAIARQGGDAVVSRIAALMEDETRGLWLRKASAKMLALIGTPGAIQKLSETARDIQMERAVRIRAALALFEISSEYAMAAREKFLKEAESDIARYVESNAIDTVSTSCAVYLQAAESDEERKR